MPGYSGTPLAKKLGIKAGCRLRPENAPENYLKLLAPLPDDVTISGRHKKDIDIWHLFMKSGDRLTSRLTSLITEMDDNSSIWVSWPKKSSKVETDITEDVIRQIALPLGLIDIKVCAVDETWSGLKLVIPKELRNTRNQFANK